MPGRDYISAYEAFERSLGDLSYPRTVSPRSYKVSDLGNGSRYQNGAPFKANPSPPLRHQLQDLSGLKKRPVTKADGFPPTPSPNLILSHDGGAPAIPTRSQHRNRVSTPPTNSSIPTPDTTPPSLVHNPTPDLSDARWETSSRSDSFATAKEDQGSQSAAGSQVRLPIQGMTEHGPNRRRGLKNLGWGMGSPDLDDDSLLRSQYEGVNTSTWNLWSPAKESERVSRPKQIAPYRASTNIPGQFEVTFLDDEPPLQDESPDQSSNQSSWLEESSVENLDAARTMPRRRGRESSCKNKTNLARPSHDSTVVEATIVESPQSRKGKGRLRHVSKNLDLRDEASGIPVEDQNSTTSSSAYLDPPVQEAAEVNDEPPFAPEQLGPLQKPDSETVQSSKTVASHPTNSNVVSTDYGNAGSSARSRPASESFLDFSLEDLHYRGLEARKRRQGLSRSNTQRSQTQHRNSAALALSSHATGLHSNPKTDEPGLSIIPQELQHLSRPTTLKSTSSRTSRAVGGNLDVPRETSATRQTHLTSPMSIRTDTPEPLVVSEAKAVSIYPHKNDSLLVIQNPASIHSRETSSSLKPLEEVLDSQNDANESSTPPRIRSANHAVESSLQPPEASRPTPAAFRSPTPVDEVPENEDETPQADEILTGASSRRPSATERARRLSGPFVTFAAAHGDVLRELGPRKHTDKTSYNVTPRLETPANENQETVRDENPDEDLPQAIPRKSSNAKRTRPLSEPFVTFAAAHADVLRDIGGRKRKNRNSSVTASGSATPTNESTAQGRGRSNADNDRPRDSSRRSSTQRARRLSEPFMTFAAAHADVLRDIGGRKRRSRNSAGSFARSANSGQEGPEYQERSEDIGALRVAEGGRNDDANLVEAATRASRRSSSTKQSRRLSEPFTTFAAAHADVLRDIGSRKRQSKNSEVDVPRPTSQVSETQQMERVPNSRPLGEAAEQAGDGNITLDETLSRDSRRTSSTTKQSRRLSEPFLTFAAAHADILRDLTTRKRSNRNSSTSIPSRPLSYATEDTNGEDDERTPPHIQAARNDLPNGLGPRQDIQLAPVVEDSRSNLSRADRPPTRDSGDSSTRGNHRAGSVRRFITRSVSRSRSERQGGSQRRLSLLRSSSSSRRATEDADQSPNISQARSHGSVPNSVGRSVSSRSSQKGRDDNAQPSTRGSSIFQGLRNRRQDRRREKLRNSIGPVFYAEPSAIADTSDGDARLYEN